MPAMPSIAAAAPLSAAILNPAIVAKTDVVRAAKQYLVLTPAGASMWVDDPVAATPFCSMREATRMAMRLPANQRAYGLPCEGSAAH